MLVMQEGDSLFGGLPIIHITYQQYIANPSAYHDPDVIVHISGFPTAGNLPADYVGYDSNLNMEDIGNIATKAIAKVEPSDTALYLHPVGSYFINKDGNSCKTDVQISVGGTITLGTNCHVVDGVANDINSKLTKETVAENVRDSSTTNIGFIKVEKYGNIIQVVFGGVRTINEVLPNSTVTVGHMPTGYYPEVIVSTFGSGVLGGVPHDIRVSITSDGAITVKNLHTANSVIYATATIVFVL